MEKFDGKKNIKFKILTLLLFVIPLFLLVGCQDVSCQNINCSDFIDTNDYGRYNIKFYVDGQLYTEIMTLDDGHIKDGHWPRMSRDYYRFDGWYYNDDYTNSLYSQSAFRAWKEVSFYGRYFEIVKLNLISGAYDEDDSLYKKTLTLDKNCDFMKKIKDDRLYDTNVSGYIFDGFYLDNEYTTKVESGTLLDDNLLNSGEYDSSKHELNLYLKYSYAHYSITYDLGAYSHFTHDNITLFTKADVGYEYKAPVTDGTVIFGGWKNKATGTIQSTIQSQLYYNDLKMEAVWVGYESFWEPGFKDRSMYYGFYPQSLKEEGVSINKEERLTRKVVEGSREYLIEMYYKGSDGYWYEECTATLHENASSLTGASGNEIINGETYYFKVEPIKWNYIFPNSYQRDTSAIISENILDTSPQENESRSSVIDDFYQDMFVKCFTYYTEDYSSYDELFSPWGSLIEDTSSSKLSKTATDYAIARGVAIDNRGKGNWWLSSGQNTIIRDVVYFDYVDIYGSYTQGNDDDYIENWSLGMGIVPYVLFNNKYIPS